MGAIFPAAIRVYAPTDRMIRHLPRNAALKRFSISLCGTPAFLHNSDALIYRQDFVDRKAGVTLSEVDVASSDGSVEKQITALYPATFFGELR